MRLSREDLILIHLLLPDDILGVSWAVQGNLEFHLGETIEPIAARIIDLQQRLSDELNKPAKETT